jgi:hypothetical protein
MTVVIDTSMLLPASRPAASVTVTKPYVVLLASSCIVFSMSQICIEFPNKKPSPAG